MPGPILSSICNTIQGNKCAVVTHTLVIFCFSIYTPHQEQNVCSCISIYMSFWVNNTFFFSYLYRLHTSGTRIKWLFPHLEMNRNRRQKKSTLVSCVFPVCMVIYIQGSANHRQPVCLNYINKKKSLFFCSLFVELSWFCHGFSLGKHSQVTLRRLRPVIKV